MLELKIENGLQEISLNGAVSVWLNLTDFAFIERLFTAFEEMDKAQEAYKAETTEADNAKVFDIARRMDAEMRERIANVFGMDVCTPLFGAMNVYAVANGLPLWANLMLAIIDEMDSTMAKEKKATNPRLQKYIAKYKR